MGKHIQLSIADPCHENWDNMTPAEKGRFCGSCQKQVIDFTNMSDSQMVAFFKKPSTGSVCGRFFQDQLDRNIEMPRKRIPWVKYFFQFALPAFLVSMKATAQGNTKVKIVTTANSLPKPECRMQVGAVVSIERSVLSKDTLWKGLQSHEHLPSVLKGKTMIETQSDDKLVFLTGRVVDERGEPVLFATVMIKGSKIGVMADSAGIFKLEKKGLQEEITLQISSVGFETREVQVNTKADNKTEMLVQLNTAGVMGEVLVVGYPATTCRSMVAGGISVKTTERRSVDVPIIKSPAELPVMIKVYPNPVQSGSSINVGYQKLPEGYYAIQLSNQSGQQVLNKQAWIDGGIQVMNIDLPHVATGVYFLRLTNKETNKRFTQRILIE